MSNITLSFVSGSLIAIPLLFFLLNRQLRPQGRLPEIDTNGPASRRYSLDQWTIVGYSETDQTNELDEAVVKKAMKVSADVIAYERSGLWVYLKRLPQ
ncbi:MAG TPA: hypothetical protein PKE64_08205 [Anaerolineae bacterium]|nr:hypothetical protein [Anaerolineae bacterium]HMR63976.1 hypothetical protein [Anaerolineae bacterium]